MSCATAERLQQTRLHRHQLNPYRVQFHVNYSLIKKKNLDVKSEDASPHRASLSASHHHPITHNLTVHLLSPLPPPSHSQWEGNNYSRWIQRTSDNRLWLKGEKAWPERNDDRSHRGRVMNKASDRKRCFFKNPGTLSGEGGKRGWRYACVKSIFNKCREDMPVWVQVHVRLPRFAARWM